MNHRILTALLAIFSIAGSLQAGMNDGLHGFINRPYAEAKDSLKILILHDQPGAVVEVKGRYQVFDPHTNTILGNRFSGKRKYLQPVHDGIRWGEEFPGIFQLLIQPDDKNTTIVVDGIEYKGRLYIYDIGGTISVVNEISFDDYIKSAISLRTGQNTPEETLAALSIAARTNAYFLKQNSKNKFWDVDAKLIDYQGVALYNQSPAIERAIRSTSKMVLQEGSSPIIIKWDIANVNTANAKSPVAANVTLDQAKILANQGEHAAQILKQAFPRAEISLLQ